MATAGAADTSEFQESTTLKFEWTLSGLKNIFESSKGDAKSKVLKSAKFGGGRWQILFYANSGTTANGEGGYVSLYLWCEPTAEEKENAVNGKWVREGRFRFSFELRNLAKMVMFNAKEAHDHSFSWKTANWGWAQFARRDTVYYLSNAVRMQDAFVIICTITSSPTPPSPPPPANRRSVPKDLLESVGGLLNDPLYSDVEFVLPRRGGQRESRTVYATKHLLRRADYFDMMFGSGFAEASTDGPTLSVGQGSHVEDGSSDIDMTSREYEDSDDEDEDATDNDAELDNREAAVPELEDARMKPDVSEDHSEDVPMDGGNVAGASGELSSATEDWQDVETTQMGMGAQEGARNVRPKLQHPSSPRSSEVGLLRRAENGSVTTAGGSVPGPSKLKVIVRDVAYNTYLAVLYYVYTDHITFAPLSSGFLSASTQVPADAPISSAGQNTSDSANNAASGVRPTALMDKHTRFASRKEWIREWARQHPGLPTPCSAKAVYRLADKLDLRELKERAFQHIVKSLTVHNVPYEVFSSFSATFEDVRKVQTQFFLEHWGEIGKTDVMRNVWPQIRAGRHPGFEEVWPLIASNLEYKPPAAAPQEGQNGGGST
ncbi:hypothetical protein GLOTRDRAFT_81686 [Gloeophyllum trabeum ATCC 11539]|uniref:MATH domain-containing protein n=1 Tax=Gloeophyllum trabeum (strain ATCC 11539 / FP-39264 / Madison 617) TaxID=670483 RepID=S7R9Z6_GLOTA|nr:uncharacterized protein GLOTRDRAFT_81686 [Gloeophyllum trabeum ATCC 11539]EPQ51070.1 hypothetical protein GLOTRDRAFT_81686 [Gloeophyllum trabeum ATCC 11539]